MFEGCQRNAGFVEYGRQVPTHIAVPHAFGLCYTCATYLHFAVYDGGGSGVEVTCGIYQLNIGDCAIG